MKTSWYAIRTKPGYQRMAAERDNSAQGETLIERNLRTENIDVFMPSHWMAARHHRTNKILQRRLPLLVGYAFVHIHAGQFETVREVDGVMCFLKLGQDFAPARFHEDDISRLVFDDFERKQTFRFEQHCRIEEARQHRVNQLRTNLRKILPKGRAVRINMRAQADKALQTMQGSAKERLVAIITELDKLTGDEIGLGNAA